MNFQTMSKQRKFIMIAAAVGLISVFFPWITVGFGYGSLNGFRDVGILVFLGFLGAGIVSLMGDQTKNLERTMWLVAMIGGAISLLFTIIFILKLTGGVGLTTYGIGVWISLLASIGVLYFAWKYKSAGDTLKSGFDSLKKDLPIMNTPGSTTAGSTRTSKVDELERLIALRNEGKISEAEYQEMKAKII